MKTFKFVALLMLIMATFACKKSTNDAIPIQKEWFQVLLVGKDTTQSKDMYARTYDGPTTSYPHAYVDEDIYLRATLLGYINGQYVVEVTNKQNCDVQLQWHYDGVNITAITPNPLSDLLNNQIGANQTQVFYLTGDKKLGKIKVMANTVCQNLGVSPKWLMLDITQDILPIKFISCKTESVNDKQVEISFEIDDPVNFDWVVVRKSLRGDGFKQCLLLGCDKTTKLYKLKVNR